MRSTAPAEARGESSWLQRRSFKGPALLQALREGKKGQRENQDENGDGGAERPVVGRAEERLHQIGDHGAGRPADQKRRQKISQRQHKSKSGTGEQAGQRKRQDYAEESLEI